MTAAPEITSEDVQIAITLASLGYLGEGESLQQKKEAIVSHLQQASLPTGGNWELMWGPQEYMTDVCFVCAGPDAAGVKRVALVIRGTQMHSFTSLLQDFEFPLVEVPFLGAPQDARIAYGFASAFERLLKARDANGNNAIDYLRSIHPGTTIDVIGHSLGGALAPLMALYVKSMITSSPVRPFPFGGQSTGNGAFADWYLREFATQPSRWINRLDVIPMLSAQLEEMKATYDPPGPKCPKWIRMIADGFIPWVTEYRCIPNPAVLPGQLYAASSTWDPWIKEIEAQHEHLYYMYLTGVSVAAIQERLGPNWNPPK